MTIVRKTLTIQANTNAILDGSLLRSQLLKISVEGLGHHIVFSNAGESKEVVHKPANGTLKFKTISEFDRRVHVIINLRP